MSPSVRLSDDASAQSHRALGSRACQPTPSIPAFRGLVDDAAIFPPGNAPLDDAVAAHREHRAARTPTWSAPSWSATPTSRPPRSAAPPTRPCRSGRRDRRRRRIEPAVTWADQAGRPRARRPRDRAARPRRPARQRAPVVAAVDQARDQDVGDDLERLRRAAAAPSPTAGWLAAARRGRRGRAAAEVPHRRRRGRPVPVGPTLAAWIDAALDRETAFKCTAGLHHAVRHRTRRPASTTTASSTCWPRRARALDGGDAVAAVLAERGPAPALAAARPDLDDALAGARRWFTSFGCCSVLEPLEDLVALGLVGRIVTPRRPADETWVDGAAGSAYDVDNLPLRRVRPRGRRAAGSASGSATSCSTSHRSRPRTCSTWRRSSPRPRSTRCWRRAAEPGGPYAAGSPPLLTDARAASDVEPHLLPLAEVTLRLPFEVADYVDFYASEAHATNVGRIFRPDQRAAAAELEAPPGRLPRPGRHGRRLRHRRRPARSGQRKAPTEAAPTFGPSRPARHRGRARLRGRRPVRAGRPGAGRATSPTTSSACVGLNDWSARDIQAWEYVPLGPVPRQVVRHLDLALGDPAGGARRRRVDLPGQDPAPLPYLRVDGRARARHRRRGRAQRATSSPGRRTPRCTGRPPRCWPT